MAGNSTSRRRGPGRPFAPNQSGNPSGLSKEARERRAFIRKALDEGFKPDEDEKVDKLVKAIVKSALEGDSAVIKLAAAYRWGQPSEHVEWEDITDHKAASTDELVTKLPEALEALGVPSKLTEAIITALKSKK